MHHSHRTKRADDQEFKQAVEEAYLFGEPVKVRPDGAILPSDGTLEGDPGPRLSLVQPDDAPVQADPTRSKLILSGAAPPEPSDTQVADDRWPWVANRPDEGEGKRGAPQKRSPQTDGTEDARQSAGVESPCGVDDESATEDLILCQPSVGQAAKPYDSRKSTRSARRNVTRPRSKGDHGPMPELPPRGDIARLGSKRQGAAPKQIGRGKLVPARLTWKPGDPFGQGCERKPDRFRWELMLTSACITAASGLICVWLLHSLFA